MRKIIDEFKAFIARGNVLDMAIGVIMANAVGKITTSLVNDVIMPITGMFAGSADLSKLNICIRANKHWARNIHIYNFRLFNCCFYHIFNRKIN